MKVTAKMIADQLGLSTSTVDRALHNRGSVSPKTLKKVIEKAKEMNYQPNQSASFLAKGKHILVAFVFPEYPNYFWEEIEMGINRALKDIQHYGFNIEIIKTPDSVAEQMKIVENIIESDDYNGLVFAPIDSTPFTNLIDKGVDKGFPVYTFNNDSPSSKRLFFVGADYLDSGRLAAELLDIFTNNPQKFAVITEEMSTFQMQQKIIGFREYMANRTTLDFVGPLKLNRYAFEKSISNLEKDLKNVDGIYVACGALSEVAKGIKKMDLKKKPILIGHDINKEIYQNIRQDVISATICQDPIYQGELITRIVFNHLMLEEKINTEQNIVKLEIVTKGNAKYYIH
ncbi:LacI family DNA-binding transcriptional regulator [Oceanobacillus caeni]|uniref:LacI family DNA-binding transcriptional regulator n=1 Tax=Oceanobacillus caeni TaxID=405946 RepID=UPI001C2452C4|nr:LacI family DNA-binding transcriptional regulator [Oceanobacillus caeni]MBU8791155.1 LacI family DNA-binding transcriptional regulator [Oceanobacillus caeni]